LGGDKMVGCGFSGQGSRREEKKESALATGFDVAFKFAFPLITGVVLGAIAGEEVGSVIHRDSSLIQQAKETIEIVKDYAEYGAILGGTGGVIYSIYSVVRGSVGRYNR
jgi:hypothetical protein